MAVDERRVAAAIAAAERVGQAQRALADARQGYQQAVRALYLDGAAPREIAQRLGISFQRVHQLVDARTPDGDASDAVPGAGSGRPPLLRCSFCERSQAEVAQLIAGPAVYICNDCAATARSLVTSPEGATTAENPYARIVRESAGEDCGFCGRPADSVTSYGRTPFAVVVAPGGSGAICSECLDLCQEIIDGESAV